MRLFLLACAACGRLGFAENEAKPDAAIAPPVLVQAEGFENSNRTTLSGQLPQDIVAGDTLIVTVDLTPSESLVSVTDSIGSTYAIAGPFDGPGLRDYITVATVATAGPVVVTATVDNAPNLFGLRLHELSGIAPAPLDVSGGSGGTTDTPATVSGPPLTTTSGGELVFALTNVFNPRHRGAWPRLHDRVGLYDGDISESRFVASPGPVLVLTDLENTGSNVGYVTAAAALRAR